MTSTILTSTTLASPTVPIAGTTSPTVPIAGTTSPTVPIAGTTSAAVRIRHLANWANLSTPLGLLIARAGGARVRRGPEALYLADRYRFAFPVAGAFTVGDVVISKHDLDDLLRRCPLLLEHEGAHSRQWMWCLGMPFLPLYVAAMGWSWVRTGDRAARNVFECRAGLAQGGYADVPPRRLRRHR